jgi:SAM-dependent methyltransferase
MPENDFSCKCPLCFSETSLFWLDDKSDITYLKCNSCFSIFKEQSSYLNPNLEEQRYKLHQNDIYDTAYQNFVSPITDAVQKDFDKGSLGLDYGCGPGPVISYVLENKGYRVKLYDPFFYPNEESFDFSYHFISCCEVMEHFFKPQEEFKKLRSLLLEGGKLYCKTNFITNSFSVDDFSQWYYKDDPTHVFFYSTKAFHFIKDTFGFSNLQVSKKLITFSL